MSEADDSEKRIASGLLPAVVVPDTSIGAYPPPEPADTELGIGTSTAAGDLHLDVIDQPARAAGDSNPALIAGRIDWRAALAASGDTAELEAERFGGASPCEHLAANGALSQEVRSTPDGEHLAMLCASCATAADRGDLVPVQGFVLNMEQPATGTGPPGASGDTELTDAELGIDPSLFEDLE